MKQKPIVIQGALQSEIDLLLEQVAPCGRREIGGFVFYEGTLDGYPVVISKTKMGEIAAAIATTLAIEHYDPAWILNQGTAGACTRALHVGDMVVGERVCYLAQYATLANRDTDALNPWKSDGYRSLDGEYISMSTDARLLAFLRGVEQPLNGHVVFGTLGSGDVWTRDTAEVDANHARLGVLCESMECTGVYVAANSRGVPAVSVRVISNNELLGETYEPESAAVAQRYAVDLVVQWAERGEF